MNSNTSLEDGKSNSHIILLTIPCKLTECSSQKWMRPHPEKEPLWHAQPSQCKWVDQRSKIPFLLRILFHTNNLILIFPLGAPSSASYSGESILECQYCSTRILSLQSWQLENMWLQPSREIILAIGASLLQLPWTAWIHWQRCGSTMCRCPRTYSFSESMVKTSTASSKRRLITIQPKLNRWKWILKSTTRLNGPSTGIYLGSSTMSRTRFRLPWALIISPASTLRTCIASHGSPTSSSICCALMTFLSKASKSSPLITLHNSVNPLKRRLYHDWQTSAPVFLTWNWTICNIWPRQEDCRLLACSDRSFSKIHLSKF